MYWRFRQIFAVILLSGVFIVLSWLAFVRSTAPAPVVHVHEDFFQSVNKAKLSDKWSNDAELDIEDDEKFHLVTNIVLVTHKAYYSNLLYNKIRPATMSELTDRQNEIEVSLQKNLNHPKVAAVHILYFHPAVMSYLHSLKLQHSEKMVLHLTRRDPTVGINLDYIGKYLSNKYVILIHQDNFLGEGWDTMIDFNMIRNKRLVYALTRHAITEKFPCNAAATASCNAGLPYLGSHDTFVFFSDKSFPREMLKEMDIVPSSSGMENVLIWHFRKTLNYKVINPCRKLKVYHNHCVPLREKGRKRYNKKGKNGLAPFTNDLS